MKRRQQQDFRQCVLGAEQEWAEAKPPLEKPNEKVWGIGFHNPSPDRLCIGDLPLKNYLINNNMLWVLRLRSFLSELDWSSFSAAYTGRGRKPGHPMLFIGLIIYGMLEGKWSLRELERLAIRDLGAWWACGGLQPDHSTIGNFINLHADILTEDFFIDLTQEIFKLLNLSPGDVAGDGTVIESAGSRLKLLKAEAAREVAKAARQSAKENPADPKAARAADQAEDAVAKVEQTQRKAKKKGRDEKKSRVCSTDPEAVMQKQKNGRGFRPSYKPSVLAEKHRIILGQTVHPSDENAPVDKMLDQYQKNAGAQPKRMMFDAGYFNFAMLERSIELDLDLLCPSGAVGQGKWGKSSQGGKFVKEDFVYDAATDQYLCPSGEQLRFIKSGMESGRAYRLYKCRKRDCQQRKMCTKAKTGRTVKRYDKDELKEVLTEVMRQPKARKAYRKRQAMVEPVFSTLRGQQGLNRFRRFGSQKVKLEFSLHCIAYNVGRLLRLERAYGLITAKLSLDYDNSRPIIRLNIKILLLAP